MFEDYFEEQVKYLLNEKTKYIKKELLRRKKKTVKKQVFKTEYRLIYQIL